MKLLLDTPNVWSDQTTDQTRVPAQHVHNSWSDRWIVVNFYRSFWRLFSLAWQRNRYATPPVSVRAKPLTCLEYQLKTVYNPWSDRWIVLKFLLEFSKADFLGITKKSLLDAKGIWSSQTTDQTRVLAQQVFNSWFDRWIVLKFL